MRRNILLSVLLLALMNIRSAQAITIFSGIDTLTTGKAFGFDFIYEKVCTTSINAYTCTNQMYLNPIRNPNLKYFLAVPEGYLMKLGNVNLDSIKIAPHDTVFQKYGRVDSISPDSLRYRVGQSYLVNTGMDRRDSSVYIIKLRVLGMTALDSAKRIVEMRFLWCYSPDGYRNYKTSGLDTFNYSTPVISHTPSGPPKINHTNVFKVVGNKFIVPREFVGTGAYLTGYDLAGRKLGRIAIRNKAQMKLSSIKCNRNEVMVVKIE